MADFTGTHVTVSVTDQPATVAEVIRNDECTAQCLAAASKTAACGCVCKGKHHGAIGGVLVPHTRRRPPTTTPAEPALFDVTDPDRGVQLDLTTGAAS
jgi:hypothetical protein